MNNVTLADIAKSAAEAASKIQEEMLAGTKPKSIKGKTKKTKSVEIITQVPTPEPVVDIAKKKEDLKESTKQIQIQFEDEKKDKTSVMFMEYAKKSLDLTDEELQKITLGYRNFKESLNYNGILLRCPDESNTAKCPYYDMCPFQKIDKYPIGKPCPVEKMIADNEMKEYYTLISNTIENGQNLPFSIVNMILSLVECDLTEVRMRSKLNKDGYTRMKQIFTPKGDLLTEEEDISKAFEIKERVARNKATIMKSLMLTPEVKKKYKAEAQAEKILSPADALIIARQKLEDRKKDATTAGT